MLVLGYLIVRSVSRPPYVSAELIPPNVISASVCICPQFPGVYALSWSMTQAEERGEQFAAIGVPGELQPVAESWATDAFEHEFGWPGVFYTLDAATRARERFQAGDDAVQVVGLSLPEEMAPAFVDHATPATSPPGGAGYLQLLQRRQPIAEGGTTLGFELLNLQVGMLEDSWLCCSLETHFEKTMGIRPNEFGFIDTLAQARSCCDELNNDGVPADLDLGIPCC